MGILDVSLASSFGVPSSAFANVMAAPLMALVTDCCRGLLDTELKAGMFGGSSKSSCKLLAIIRAHKRRSGVLYLLPCFS